MIEDVENKRNLSRRAIDATKEVDREMLEKRIVKPNQLILLVEHFINADRGSLKDRSGGPYL
jgi:hypothetical protein